MVSHDHLPASFTSLSWPCPGVPPSDVVTRSLLVSAVVAYSHLPFQASDCEFLFAEWANTGGISVHAFLWFGLWPSSLNLRPQLPFSLFFIGLWVFRACWFLPPTVLPTKLQPYHRQCSGFSIVGAEFLGDGPGSPFFHSLICFSHSVISALLFLMRLFHFPCRLSGFQGSASHPLPPGPVFSNRGLFLLLFLLPTSGVPSIVLGPLF